MIQSATTRSFDLCLGSGVRRTEDPCRETEAWFRGKSTFGSQETMQKHPMTILARIGSEVHRFDLFILLWLYIQQLIYFAVVVFDALPTTTASTHGAPLPQSIVT